jgi:hypothetical protein
MKTESFFNVERFLRDDVYASENIHHVALIVNNYIDNLESLEGSEKSMLCRVLGIYFDELGKPKECRSEFKKSSFAIWLFKKSMQGAKSTKVPLI